MRISDWSSDMCSSDLSCPAGLKEDAYLFTPRGRWCWRQRRQPHRRPQVSSPEMPREDVERLVRIETKLDTVLSRSDEERQAHERDMSAVRRSEKRRVGKEGVSACRSRWAQLH